ncbi:MAG: hypothetical protein A2W90_03385 [Bacteroidetes bacterium GWF2_42_66]|nr:MAG: hypothetical protein A2W92_18300 [Bacteroidetes bacterium GWA2_42_15]OFY02621.1 MAG: hypothetical protein A2W89_22465 [Bacteroidetes bacterium GWE2_42_39]OFY41279.1 MAG: hypothetical protein A2W90_03385 [Bacteroidetes bacterium GWF2_42_66]HBL75531.1 hypothetical protein [Prolixibacteraceae bacterium]HCR89700.1 hypothetical protein [Prolixibacteraceae bacterium]
MRKILYSLVFMLAQLMAISQNTSERILNSEEKLSIGGYAQIDYNQKIDGETKYNGIMDVHRMVLMVGYKFNERTRFITELEVEHVQEVYVEQAFLDYKLKEGLNFRAGLLLIPMGIINELHEPATFNGVERPNLDNTLIPTTWREIGAGFTGRIGDSGLKYQLYVVNGFLSYNGSGLLRGSDAFRRGRQKGAESIFSNPNLSGKIEYSGISSLKLGLSTYLGKSQSTLYDGIDKDNQQLIAVADSSVLGLSMIGLDFRYLKKGWNFKGQFNYASVKNTDEYNEFAAKDMGSALLGYYLEAGYNLLHSKDADKKLVPFVRYEKYDTHYKVDGISKNVKFNHSDVTAGIGWWMAEGAVLKADVQWLGNDGPDDTITQINLGVGIWF